MREVTDRQLKTKITKTASPKKTYFHVKQARKGFRTLSAS